MPNASSGATADVDDAVRRAHHAHQALRDAGANQKGMLASIKELGTAANEIIKQALAVAKVPL